MLGGGRRSVLSPNSAQRSSCSTSPGQPTTCWTDVESTVRRSPRSAESRTAHLSLSFFFSDVFFSWRLNMRKSPGSAWLHTSLTPAFVERTLFRELDTLQRAGGCVFAANGPHGSFDRAENVTASAFFSDCDLCTGLDTLVSRRSREPIPLNSQPDFRCLFEGS